MSGRGSRYRCTTCGCRTRSLTRLCVNHRNDDPPVVTMDGPMLAVAGIALTVKQAIRLVDSLVDAVEQIRTTPASPFHPYPPGRSFNATYDDAAEAESEL